jgi:ribonuclease BN (tRNA processing enzyme)
MKLTVLGRYGTYPAKNGGTASYILNDDGKNIVLDMGSSSLSRLQNFVTLNDIDTIILSHLHSDHISDLLVLRYMAEKLMNEGKLKNKLRIYCPNSPENEFKIISSCKAFDINVINSDTVLNIGKMKISFYKMTHSELAYGIKIDNGDKIFAYTGDTTLNDNLKNLLKDADIVLGDCGTLKDNKKESSPHLSVTEIATITKEFNNILYTAHLSAGLEKEIYNEAVNINPSTVLIEELKTYVI